jgi:hypothetical protein
MLASGRRRRGGILSTSVDWISPFVLLDQKNENSCEERNRNRQRAWISSLSLSSQNRLRYKMQKPLSSYNSLANSWSALECTGTGTSLLRWASTTSTNNNHATTTTNENQTNESDEELSRKEQMMEQGKRAMEQGKRAKASVQQGANNVRGFIKKYGAVFVGTYMSVYVVTLTGLFVGIDSGAIDPASLSIFEHWFEVSQPATDAVTDAASASTGGGDEEKKSTVQVISAYLEQYEWTKNYAPIVAKNPHFANLAIAWIATKTTEPIRLAITFPIVPRIARYIGHPVVDDEEDNIDDETKQDTPNNTKKD